LDLFWISLYRNQQIARFHRLPDFHGNLLYRSTNRRMNCSLHFHRFDH